MKKIKTILAILPVLLFSCAGDDVENIFRLHRLLRQNPERKSFIINALKSSLI